MNINVCILALLGQDGESFFHDVARCVLRQYQNAGYSCTLYTNKIIKGALNIVFGCGTSKAPDIAQLHSSFTGFNIVIFNMEPLRTTSHLVTTEYLNFISHYCIFDYSEENVKFLSNKGFKAFLFPIIPEAPVAFKNTSPRDIDVLFVGGLSDRRVEILDSLKSEYSIETVNGLYGTKLHPVLSRSHILLNLHYYPDSPCEVARLLPAARRVNWILSETTSIPFHFLSVVDNVVVSDREDLGRNLKAMLAAREIVLRKPHNEDLYNLIQANAEASIHSITASAF